MQSSFMTLKKVFETLSLSGWMVPAAQNWLYLCGLDSLPKGTQCGSWKVWFHFVLSGKKYKKSHTENENVRWKFLVCQIGYVIRKLHTSLINDTK